MRTTLSEIRLFHDTFYKQETSLDIINRKEWGVGRNEKERVRCGAWVERVTVCVINLTIGHVFMRV
jgi:hypothetical protein